MTDDIALLLAMIDDAMSAAARKSCPKFCGFLSDVQSSAVRNYAASQSFCDKFGNDARYCFFGGYDDAERLIFAALPDWASGADDIDFPVTALEFSHKAEFSLAHKDYLGSLMALGIERDRVGDIIVREDGAVVFLHDSIADFAVSQIEKIGRVGVKTQVVEPKDLIIEHKYREISDSIASARLDCIVSSLARCSRGAANELIGAKTVFINGIECTDAAKRVLGKDVITIRRKGKFIIDSVSDKTKKGRTVLRARQKL